jgi:hypothetical protein
MFPPVLQDVDERKTHFARGCERPRVIAVPPHRPPPAESAVHRTREPDREALNAPRERAAIVRFEDEMDVVRLDGELEDAEALPRSPRQALTQDREHRRFP